MSSGCSIESLASRLSDQYANKKIMLACSGGADSICLAEILQVAKLNFTLCYVNHRTEFGARSQKFVGEFAKSKQLELICKPIAKHTKPSQAAWREQRYLLLRKAAQVIGAEVVMTAHHADDQVERLIHNFLRGGRLAAIVAMASSAQFAPGIMLARPMLDVSKEQILAYCGQQNISYLCDQANFDLKYARGRIRERIIPEIFCLFADYRKNLLAAAEYRKKLNEYLDAHGQELTQMNNLAQICLIGDFGLQLWLQTKLQAYGLSASDKEISDGCAYLLSAQTASKSKLRSVQISQLRLYLYHGDLYCLDLQRPQVLGEFSGLQLVETLQKKKSQLLSLPTVSPAPARLKINLINPLSQTEVAGLNNQLLSARFALVTLAFASLHSHLGVKKIRAWLSAQKVTPDQRETLPVLIKYQAEAKGQDSILNASMPGVIVALPTLCYKLNQRLLGQLIADENLSGWDKIRWQLSGCTDVLRVLDNAQK